jgi:hypothetical protein
MLQRRQSEEYIADAVWYLPRVHSPLRSSEFDLGDLFRTIIPMDGDHLLESPNPITYTNIGVLGSSLRHKSMKNSRTLSGAMCVHKSIGVFRSDLTQLLDWIALLAIGGNGTSRIDSSF